MLYVGLLITIFVDYVRPDAYIPIISILKINTIIPILVLIGAIIYSDKNKNKKIIDHMNSKLLLFFIFLLVVSILISDVTLYSYKVFKVVIGFILWYYIIIKIVTDIDKLKGVFTIFVISHVLLVILNPNIILDPSTRTYITGNAFLGDGNDFALSASLTIPMCIFMIIENKNIYKRSLYIAAFIVLILAIIGTQSRGASLALFGTFIYLWWMSKQKIIGVLLMISVGVMVLSFAPPVYFERMNSIVNYESEGSAMGRIIAWKTAIRMANEYPLTGVGAGHFPVKLGTEFRPPEFGDENLPWITAHSSYFLILGELGLPGIVFFLTLIIGNYINNNKYIKTVMNGDINKELKTPYRNMFLMLNSSLVAFAIGGAFLSVAYYPHIYVLSGLIVAAQYTFLSDCKKFEEHIEHRKKESRPDRFKYYR